MFRRLQEKFPRKQKITRVTQSPASLLSSRQSPEADAVDWGRTISERYLMELPQGADGRAYYLEIERGLEEEKVLLLNAMHAILIIMHVNETTQDVALKQKTEKDRVLFLSTLMQTTTDEFLQNIEQIKNSYPETQTSLTIPPALNNAFALMMYGSIVDLNLKFKASMCDMEYLSKSKPSVADVLRNENMMVGVTVACCLLMGTDLTFRRFMSRISDENRRLFEENSGIDAVCFAAAHAQCTLITTLHQMGFELNHASKANDIPFKFPLQAAFNILYLNNVFQPGAIPVYEKTIDTLLQLGADPEAGDCIAIKYARELIAKAKADASLSNQDREKICAALHKVIDAPSPRVQVARAGM